MRDKLIELINRAKQLYKEDMAFDTIDGAKMPTETDYIVDYLLANGVLCPPCKVGDTVYYITGMGHNLVKSAKVKEIILDENGIKDLYVQGNGHNFENSFDIFFLTREEAEKKLEE